jgi:type I restriction enzyme S subunit
MSKIVFDENYWQQVELESVCQKISVGLAISVTPYMREMGTKLIRNQNIRSNYFDDASLVYVDDEFAKSQNTKRVRAGDVISVRTGANIGDTCVVPNDFDGALTFTTLIARPNKKLLDSHYLSQYMNSSLGRAEVNRLMAGGGKGNLNAGELKRYRVLLPPIHEQKKIADVLATWDEANAITEKLITAKRKLKYVLSNRLLFGKNRVLPMSNIEFKKYSFFSIPTDWDIAHIGDVAVQVGSRNKLGQNLPVLSCTKHFGLVDSLRYFGKQIFSQDTSSYKIARRGQFAYATNHIEEGSIGYQNLYDVALISPMYTVFQTKSAKIDDSYLYKLLKTEIFRHIFEANTSASVDRRGSLRWNEFSQLKIPLPPIEEQKIISQILNTAQDEINGLVEYHNQLQKQKRGLMQKLLTGEWRVTVEEAA